MKKDNKESYAHSAAKSTFVSWLRSAATDVGDSYVTVAGITWRVNRGAPLYGVFEEYPLTATQSGVWDEESGFEIGDDCPTYEWMLKNSKDPFKIADIAISHKGWITAVIEIVHKNGLSAEKKKFYSNFPLRPEVYAVPTHWVLGQIGVPKSMPKEFRVV